MTNRSRVCCATVTPSGSVVGAKLQAFGRQSRSQSLNYATGAPAHSQKRGPAGIHGGPRFLWRLRGAPKGAGDRVESIARRQEHDRRRAASGRGQAVGLARARRSGFFVRIEVVVRGSEEREADLP